MKKFEDERKLAFEVMKELVVDKVFSEEEKNRTCIRICELLLFCTDSKKNVEHLYEDIDFDNNEEILKLFDKEEHENDIISKKSFDKDNRIRQQVFTDIINGYFGHTMKFSKKFSGTDDFYSFEMLLILHIVGALSEDFSTKFAIKLMEYFEAKSEKMEDDEHE